MKISRFLPILLVPTFLLACTNNQDESVIKKDEKLIKNQQKPAENSKKEQNPELKNVQTELVFQQLDKNLESLFGQKSAQNFTDFYQKTRKTIFDLLDKEVVNGNQKQELVTKINQVFEKVAKIAENNNYDLSLDKQEIKAEFSALKNIFHKSSKTDLDKDLSSNQSQKGDKIANLISESRPSGQNFSRFVGEKRLVLDQYENDFPEKEWNWYRINSNFNGSGIGITNKSELAKKPKNFGIISEKIIEELNKKAKATNQPLFEKAQFRLFSLPDFNENGIISGVKFNKYERGFTSPAWWKASKDGDYTFGGPNRLGLPRKIVSESYQNLIPNVVSIKIENLVIDKARQKLNNKSAITPEFSFGTLGILDYQIPENSGKYPLKWFFLTNAHVANNLQIANDANKDKLYGRDFSNYNDSDLRLNTKSITLTKLKKNIPLNSILPTSRNGAENEYYTTVKLAVKEKDGKIFNTGLENVEEDNKGKDEDYQEKSRIKPSKEMNVKTVFIGSDVFKFKPKDFTSQTEFSDFEDVLDFAIIEINFPDEESAKKITNEFYEKQQKTPLKVSNFNPFAQEEYLKLEKTPFYGLGYSGAKNDPTISPNDFPADFELQNYSVSPWINKNFRLFNSKNENDSLIQGGSEFSWSRSYRNFVNIPGISDYLITTPVLWNNYFKLDYFDENTKERKTKNYLNAGLGTVIDNFTAGGGLSGTPIFLKNGEIYSVVYASDKTASANLTLNLRSYGYNYQGYYGKYNLPRYDLIYGDTNQNGEQQKSYWKSLLEMYRNNSNFKTSLFPNGLNQQVKIF